MDANATARHIFNGRSKKRVSGVSNRQAKNLSVGCRHGKDSRQLGMCRTSGMEGVKDIRKRMAG